MKFNFEHGVTLVEFWRARQITECEEKPGHNAEDNDPNSFNYGMPKAQKIQASLLLAEINVATERRKWNRASRSQRRNRMERWVSHFAAQSFLH